MRCFCGHQGDHRDCCIVTYLLDSGETTDTFFQVPLLCCFFISRQETISQVNNKMFPLKCRAEASLQMSSMSRSYEFKGKECYAITEVGAQHCGKMKCFVIGFSVSQVGVSPTVCLRSRSEDLFFASVFLFHNWSSEKLHWALGYKEK